LRQRRRSAGAPGSSALPPRSALLCWTAFLWARGLACMRRLERSSIVRGYLASSSQKIYRTVGLSAASTVARWLRPSDQEKEGALNVGKLSCTNC
jgi:hypothetical protein